MKNLRNLKLPKVEKVILARAPKDGEGNLRASDRRFRIKTSGEKLREAIRRSTPKVTWDRETCNSGRSEQIELFYQRNYQIPLL